MRELKVGTCYKHFKGGVYKVLYLGVHTETGERFAVYQDITKPGEQAWVRPLDMFLEGMDTTKYPNAGQKYRLEEMEE